MYIRPWAAMKLRKNSKEPLTAVSDSTDSAIDSTGTSPVAQLKEKFLGMDFRVEFRRAFSIVSEKEVDEEENLAKAGIAVIKDALKAELDMKKVIVLGDTGVSLAHPGIFLHFFVEF